ncbi:MAG: hypothetical protein GY864_05695 [Desulfobacterales bacterium]|nr:hypothetical protein [Desulfobacterales bacterium]
MELSEGYVKYIKDHFPAPYNTFETYSDYILPKIQQHETLCSAVIAEIKKNILPPLLKKYHYRFFCRIDADHKVKQPLSIIDKIIRLQNSEDALVKGGAESYTLENFSTKMKDLARFRIVCNFIQDVDKVATVLRNNKILKRMFSVEEKSTMDLHPGTRKSGERSVKFILEYKKQPELFLEIQVMTQLSEAWDKKDHFLVYEIRRRFPEKEDKNFPDFLDAKMHAMAELLYVADNYFEALRTTREDKNDEGSAS